MFKSKKYIGYRYVYCIIIFLEQYVVYLIPYLIYFLTSVKEMFNVIYNITLVTDIAHFFTYFVE